MSDFGMTQPAPRGGVKFKHILLLLLFAFVGGGVATFDCSGDGRADMLLAGGKAPATFYRNNSALAGDLKFAPEVSGLELDAVLGAYPLDIDSDVPD